MGRLVQGYPEYCNSGIEWLGKVPSDWLIIRMDDLTDTVRDQIDQNTLSLFSVRHYSIPSVQQFGMGLVEEGQTIDSSKFIVADGDVLFSKLNPRKETITIVQRHEEKIVSSTEFVVLRPKSKTDARYLKYLLHAQELKTFICSQVESATKSHQRVNPSVVSKLKFSAPSQKVRSDIANFLDHETDKIDTLIDKQQQLIKMLKEKRKAVISHAVTKGLNPDAPMKNSGVEWLGEVPEHWNVKPLKHLCRFSGGGTPSKDNVSYWEKGDIPWVSPKDMRTFLIADTQDKLTATAVEESSTNYVAPGALLMVVRSGILQRKIPIAINTVQVTLNQDMKALRFGPEMVVNYAANFVLGYQDSLLLEWAKQGATVESIEHEYLANSLIPVPPHNEQLEINQFIEDKMEVLNTLEEKAMAGIELLKERRTALISAAVTGKIDVRNWKPEQSETRMEGTE